MSINWEFNEDIKWLEVSAKKIRVTMNYEFVDFLVATGKAKLSKIAKK